MIAVQVKESAPTRRAEHRENRVANHFRVRRFPFILTTKQNLRFSLLDSLLAPLRSPLIQAPNQIPEISYLEQASRTIRWRDCFVSMRESRNDFAHEPRPCVSVAFHLLV